MNSFWLIAFGAPVAWRFGGSRFIGLCLISGFGGALAHYLSYSSENAPVIGASAITSGAMAATLRFAFTGAVNYIPRTDYKRYRLPAPSLKEVFTTPTVVVLVVVWFGINLFFSIGAAVGGGNVAWQAHIGGFLAGMIAFDLLDRENSFKSGV